MMKVGVLAAAASLVLFGSSVTAASSFTDIDVLNFALNLECLEAEFYSWVAYGKGIASINSTLVGNSSAGLTATSSGGQARTDMFDPDSVAIATEIAENEIAHVRYLRAAITAAGGTADNCPQLSLSPATFTTAAKAALSAAGITLASDTDFNPYSGQLPFYLGAFIFEDVGVTAYKGAVQVLQSSTYATVAAGIGAVEAGHAAVIRSRLYAVEGSSTGLFTNSPAANTPVTVLQAVNAITVLRDTLGGTSASGASVENTLTRTSATFTGVPGGGTGPDLFAADPTTSVAFTRIPKQVLNIVYFDTTTAAGGFFPNGISGNNHVINVTGSVTTTACSGAFSMASLSAVVPLLLTGVAVMCGLLW